ncbi:hypothetical protein RD792_010855 [Penstemon davidsonii]|uniref:Protein arginine N-methyltransferase domain-containing protein n=1 Tax=Penstemon davidsonii TaxID=160366 RepID=A0ABR0D2Z1_9LAMI|nr:hypothetical protein RD792_010855 [Penstemon davidsonii]
MLIPIYSQLPIPIYSQIKIAHSNFLQPSPSPTRSALRRQQPPPAATASSLRQQQPANPFLRCLVPTDYTSFARFHIGSSSVALTISVECSSMADMAQVIINKNGFSKVITVLKGEIEVVVLPVSQVDVIISEWMGYLLVYENMLNTVLYARDKWLVQDGLVLPDKASLYLTVIEDADYKEDKIELWNGVYGFDMSCIRKLAISEPLVDTVKQSQIVTNCQLLKTMDISKMSAGDASFTAPFKLVAELLYSCSCSNMIV